MYSYQHFHGGIFCDRCEAPIEPNTNLSFQAKKHGYDFSVRSGHTQDMMNFVNSTPRMCQNCSPEALFHEKLIEELDSTSLSNTSA
jgi:hypothetical protein